MAALLAGLVTTKRIPPSMQIAFGLHAYQITLKHKQRGYSLLIIMWLRAIE